MKKLLGPFSTAIFSSTCGQAANIHLLNSTPADGSVTDTVPSAFVLQFSDQVQIHSLQLKRDDQKRTESVSNLPHKEATAFTIAAPALTTGAYVLHWEVFTRGSTALRGSVRFTVSGGQLRNTVSSVNQ